MFGLLTRTFSPTNFNGQRITHRWATGGSHRSVGGVVENVIFAFDFLLFPDDECNEWIKDSCRWQQTEHASCWWWNDEWCYTYTNHLNTIKCSVVVFETAVSPRGSLELDSWNVSPRSRNLKFWINFERGRAEIGVLWVLTRIKVKIFRISKTSPFSRFLSKKNLEERFLFCSVISVSWKSSQISWKLGFSKIRCRRSCFSCNFSYATVCRSCQSYYNVMVPRWTSIIKKWTSNTHAQTHARAHITEGSNPLNRRPLISRRLLPSLSGAVAECYVAFNVEDGGRRVSPISIGLREQCADRSACILGKTSTVGA